jgi:phosphatidylserine/phosphatidylglycerophosphate/cardiolipin synthase-like enzyme
MAELIRSPWEDTFLDLLKGAKKNVYLASPFIKSQTASLIARHVAVGIDFRYINCFKLAHFHVGASDLDALRILNGENCKQKSVHNLHAKLFVFDDSAVVTSGNLTPGGLRNNLEYGVLVEGNKAHEIKRDYVGIFDNPEYPEITLEIISKAEKILGDVPREKQKTLKVAESALFEEFINDENIDERFDGGISSILSNLSAWKKDVFVCLTKIHSDIFSLEDAYAWETRLSRRHPGNRNVRAKIRQQLQYLRDIGLVEFVRPGKYKKLWD